MRLERGKRRPPPGSCYLEGRPRVSQSYRKTLFLFFFLHDQNRARPLLEPGSTNSRQHLEDNHVFPEHFQLFKLRLDFGGQQRQWRLYYHQLRYQRPGRLSCFRHPPTCVLKIVYRETTTALATTALAPQTPTLTTTPTPTARTTTATLTYVEIMPDKQTFVDIILGLDLLQRW